jgi:hypothetical protein
VVSKTTGRGFESCCPCFNPSTSEALREFPEGFLLPLTETSPTSAFQEFDVSFEHKTRSKCNYVAELLETGHCLLTYQPGVCALNPPH